MATLVLPYNIINNTPADAVQVDTNYDVITEYVNSQVIRRDGAISMDAPLLLKADPTEKLHAATKSYVDAVLPIGMIMLFGGPAAPAGQWLLCDGSTKSTVTYKTLFDVLGYRYGGSGGNFNLPNMKGRFPIGSDSTQTAFDKVGESGGTWTVPVAQHAHPMPHTHEHNHTHTIDHNHPSAVTGSTTPTHDVDLSVRNSANAGGGHSVMPSGADGTTTSYTNNPVVSGGAHTHTIDLPVTTGLKSGVPSEATTSAVSTANTSNNTKATTSTELIGSTHIPPYVVVQYIIRAA